MERSKSHFDRWILRSEMRIFFFFFFIFLLVCVCVCVLFSSFAILTNWSKHFVEFNNKMKYQRFDHVTEVWPQDARSPKHRWLNRIKWDLFLLFELIGNIPWCKAFRSKAMLSTQYCHSGVSIRTKRKMLTEHRTNVHVHNWNERGQYTSCTNRMQRNACTQSRELLISL